MQLEAVRQVDGAILILAGAGSGKTHALTYRVAWLLENGVNPYHIIAITFTNKAAKEMRRRVNDLNERGESVWVSTFHSSCARILRREANNIGYDRSFSIIDADDSEKLCRSCIRETNVNEKQYTPSSCLSYISKQKDKFISSEQSSQNAVDYREKILAKIYGLYQRRLKESNSMDFDDLIYNAVRMFTSCPEVLEQYQSRFHYILVDEFQDTNTLQYRLIRLLADKYKNICVVGDDDQSIYSWRGANIRNILQFEKDFPGAKIIRLEQNYRSTQTILDAANAVIKQNNYRMGKNLWTRQEGGLKVSYYHAFDDRDEGKFVASLIAHRQRKKSKFSDFAVLYRTNAQSRAIEDEMVRFSIPYRLFGGVRFYQRMEIKDILAYLKAIHNPLDSVSYMRIINVPKRGIGASTVEAVHRCAVENEIPFYMALYEAEHLGLSRARVAKINEFVTLMDSLREYSKTHAVTQLLNKVMDDTGYRKELEADSDVITGTRLDNIEELYVKMKEFENGPSAQSDSSLNDNALGDNPLGSFLEDVALVADIDNYEEGEDACVLMTLHSAKGLEFPVVFLVGLEEGIFPSYRSVTAPSKEPLEEERRLCYVGITRAKRELFISAASQRMQHGQIVANLPSRFIREIPGECLTRLR
jgi:DNA helicase-2/ATP-dependent DNA helicase PcrA